MVGTGAVNTDAGGTRRERTPLYALLAANIVSMVGNELTFIAIPWFVLQTTGSAARMGLTAAVSVVALILAGFFAGGLVDRLGYKRMSVISDLASGVTVALIPLLHYSVGLAFWQLLVLVFLGSVFDTPGYTARRALFPELIARAGMLPERANSVYMIAGRLASVLGAPLAGVLIAVLGASNVLWLDAATFAISAVIVTALIPSTTIASAGVEGGPVVPNVSYFKELADGLRLIRNDSVLLWLTVVSALSGLLAEPVYSVILPVYAREVYGKALDLGLMFAALGIGSIFGALIFAIIGHRLPRRGTIVAGFLGRALTFWVLIPFPPLWIVAGSIVVNSTLLEPVNPLSLTVEQERVPEGMRGRYFGTAMALGNITRPIGMIVYGLLIQQVGLETALYVFASVNLILPALIVGMPAFRQMGTPARRPAVPSPVAPIS
jgi:MFS family permease